MKTVVIKSISGYIKAVEWCKQTLGFRGDKWYEDHPPWQDFGITFIHDEDYVLFILVMGDDCELKGN